MDYLELTCDQQRARAVGFAPVILCKAGVPSLIRPCHIENLQTPILQDEHPEEKTEGILHIHMGKTELYCMKYSA